MSLFPCVAPVRPLGFQLFHFLLGVFRALYLNALADEAIQRVRVLVFQMCLAVCKGCVCTATRLSPIARETRFFERIMTSIVSK